MSAQVRILREKVRAVKSIQKTTRAMEMIATSRIAKAQAQVAASIPYATQITGVLAELASSAILDHPLLTERSNPARAAILLITSDRGLCGGYNANVLKSTEELAALLRTQGKEPLIYVIGRKGLGYFTFRERAVMASWTGFSEKPSYADAERAAAVLLPAFLAGSEGEVDDGHGGRMAGIDEIHVISTHFVSMLTQEPRARRVAPLLVEYVGTEDTGPRSMYEFEPASEALLGAMLPKYVTARIYAALLDAAASESAARRQACKSATDNANDIIRNYTRQANQARQAQITQELTEIVGGADALAATASEED